jgi:hypothetical protein
MRFGDALGPPPPQDQKSKRTNTGKQDNGQQDHRGLVDHGGFSVN